MNQLSRKLTLLNELGMHARPAALIVQKVSCLECDVLIESNGEKANGKSIMGILMLAIESGTEIIVHACGPDAEKAVHLIEQLVEDKFGEE